MKLKFQANQVISDRLRLIYVFIFQQTASILNSLHPTVHCGHGIHYCCRSTSFELGVHKKRWTDRFDRILQMLRNIRRFLTLVSKVMPISCLFQCFRSSIKIQVTIVRNNNMCLSLVFLLADLCVDEEMGKKPFAIARFMKE